MLPAINQAVLSQVIQTLRDGNVRYCEALGFNREELNGLNTLTFEELTYMGNISAQFLKITINHDVLRKMLVQVRQEQKFQQLVGQTVQLGSSIALTSHYFGISIAEISARRRLMGIHVRQGRNQVPGEEEEAALWNRWQEIKVDNVDSIPVLKAMMLLAQERSLLLVVVWNLVWQWEKSRVTQGKIMTLYIQTLIATTGDKLQQRVLKDPGTASDSLLFMGNQHDTVPRRLLQDPLLSPRNKFAWQMIRMQTQDNDGTVFPPYNELQVQLSDRPQDKGASRNTVSRALLMLRLTRWFSLCHKTRGRVSRRILGNIYTLHDEPLSVLDAVRFDASYPHLLEQCSRHESRAIRATAQGILYDIRQNTSLRYLSSCIELLEERTCWQQRQSPEETRPETPGLNTVPGKISPGTESGLNRKPGPNGLISNQDQAPVRTVPIDLCNSTTARAGDSPPNWPPEIPLTYPEKQLVLQSMKNMPSALRQDVLDDAARRIVRGSVQNPLAYLLATLRKAQDGEFNQYRRGKAAVPEFVPPVASEPDIPARPRQKRDISKLVAEIRTQCLGSG